MNKISIIIPTYNEKNNLKELFKRIDNALKKENYEIILVDDDSPDKTWLIAKKLKNNYPLKIIRRTAKKDLSLSVLEGFKAATGNILGVIDADLSHSPEYIPSMIAFLKRDYDLVIGSKIIKKGKVEKWPFHRKLIAWTGRLLAKPLTSVKDNMSGFFFFKKDIIKRVNLTPKGYKILLEVLVKGKYKKTKEIPIVFRNRRVGKSKLSLKVHWDYLLHLLSLYKYKLLKK